MNPSPMTPSNADIARELQDWLAPPEDDGFTEAVMARIAADPAAMPAPASSPVAGAGRAPSRSPAERWATPVLALCSSVVAAVLALLVLPDVSLSVGGAATDALVGAAPTYALYAGVAVLAAALWLAVDPDALA